MKKIIIIQLCAIFTFAAQAQHGWCIVEKGTKYKVYQKSYTDIDAKTNTFLDINNLTINVGEAVYFWEETPNYLIVSESHGRISLIQKTIQNTLTVAPVDGSIAILNTDNKLDDGQMLYAGSALWITKIDEKNGLGEAFINDGKKIAIELKYLNFVSNTIEANSKNDNTAFKVAQ
jgi:hypothetical protein